MANNFICVRHEQIKSAAACNGHGRHNSDNNYRQNLTNVNSDKSKDNIHIAFSGYNDEISVYQNFKQMKDNYEQVKGRKLRGDAVQAIETVFTASPEIFLNADGSRSVENERAFMRAAIKTMNKYFGDCPRKLDFHLDEKTPHIHCISIPYDKSGKAYNREISNIKAYKAIQDDFAEACRSQGLDVQRGIDKKITHAKHEKPKHWVAEEQALEEKYERDYQELSASYKKQYEDIKQDKEQQIKQIETQTRAEIQQAKDDWELIKQYEERKAREKYSRAFDHQSLDDVIQDMNIGR